MNDDTRSSDKYSKKNNNGFCVAKHFIYNFLYFSQFDLVSLNFYFAYYLFLFFSACLCVYVYPRYSKSLKQLATRCQPLLAREGRIPRPVGEWLQGEIGHKEVHGATPKTSLCLLWSLVNC